MHAEITEKIRNESARIIILAPTFGYTGKNILEFLGIRPTFTPSWPYVRGLLNRAIADEVPGALKLVDEMLIEDVL